MEEVSQTADRIGSAGITYVELRAALAAAFRDGRVLHDLQADRLATLERLWAWVVEVPMDSQLLRLAGDLAESMALRGYDAVQLAALTRLGEASDVSFACWDGQLRSAARRLGYSLIPNEGSI